MRFLKRSEKAAYPLYYTLAVGATTFGFLFVPLLALANPFSLATLLSGFGQRVDAASVDSSNSQRMALLAPATNLDPNPTKGGNNFPVEGGQALVASVGPSGTVADVEEMPSSSQISVYTVRSGDTLSEIAAMFDVTVNTILWANDIKNGIIHEGDQLVILPVTGIRHTVVAGETLKGLAKKYSGLAEDIAIYNGLDAGSALAAGQVVIIPNGEIPEVVKPPIKTPGKTKTPAKASKNNGRFLGGSGPAVDGFAWPVAGGHVTQGIHGWNGVDIGAPQGTSILAAAAGTVIVARGGGGWNGGYGNYVVVSHPNGTQTLYAHLSKVTVSSGASVSQGEMIGLAGNTGKSTGSHLHFEVRGAKNPFAN